MANGVGNWVAESCTTIGTGDLLLTGNNLGYSKFSSSMSAGTVWYEVYEGNNKEVGLGTFDGDSTIERTTIHATLVGNVYDNSNPSPLSLNGSSIVVCTFNAEAYTELYNHTINTSNPHSVTKAQVGLGNCDNTSDVNKPISTATQTELDLKTEWEESYTLRRFDYGHIIRHGTSLYVANKTTYGSPTTSAADWDLMVSDGVNDVNNIYDGFDSTATDQALSANKGKELYDLFMADVAIDGGFSNSVYTAQQVFDGGNA